MLDEGLAAGEPELAPLAAAAGEWWDDGVLPEASLQPPHQPASWPGASGHWRASVSVEEAAPPPPRALAGAAPLPPVPWLPQLHQPAMGLPSMPTSSTAAAAHTQQPAKRCAKAASKAAAPAAGADGQPRLSRQQMRQLQHQQRRVEQQRIKSLELQLCGMRQRLESLSLENKGLKQRQAALNATLDMQQQLQAALATTGTAGGGSGGGAAGLGSANTSALSLLSEEDEEAFSLDLSSLYNSDAEEEGEEVGTTAAPASGDTRGTAAARGLAVAPGLKIEASSSAHPTVTTLAAAGQAGQDGGSSRESWFFSATLRQHIQWYQQQVERLQGLLQVLDAIPPRMHRSLGDYERLEEAQEAVAAVLADIDDWTIRMAALRPEDYGVVIHNNLQDVLDGSGGGAGDGGGGGGGGEHPASPRGVQSSEDAVIWQELVAQLQLTPQQQQTLEAHQSLFEQRAAALEESKAAVLAAIAAAAAKQDSQTAALELLEGAAAFRASLQQDMQLKAPVMISLRKVLTPMQMARLTVSCWPFYTTMKNVSRAACGRWSKLSGC